MEKNTYPRTILWVLALAIFSTQGVLAEDVSGNLKFSFLFGDEPLRPRGDGPPTRWVPEFDIEIRHDACKMNIVASVGGGAYFDNPDRLTYTFGGDCEFGQWFAGIEFFNDYPISKEPAPDPDARRPNSGVNQTWLYGGRNFVIAQRHLIRIFYKHGVRGNQPLFIAAYTRPYVSQDIASMWRFSLRHRLSLQIDQHLFLTDEFNQAGLYVYPRVLIPVYHQIHMVVGGRRYFNINASPSNTNYVGASLRDRGSLVVGLELPFGSEN